MLGHESNYTVRCKVIIFHRFYSKRLNEIINLPKSFIVYRFSIIEELNFLNFAIQILAFSHRQL